jgi:DNA-binding CsgD family transcriptional regulator
LPVSIADIHEDIFAMKAASILRPESGPTNARNDHQELSDVIGVVYDAAIDQSAWPTAVERVAGFVDGAGAGLFFKDADAQHVVMPYRFGFVKLFPVALFRPVYPTLAGHFLADIEQPVATADLMSFDELAETELYREWGRPQGFVDFVSVVLDRSATSVAMFGVFRHERNGFVDDETRHRMRLIVPHVRRAVLIARMFDLRVAEAAMFADTLDGLDAGLYLVDAGGRLIHANAAGHAVLDAGDILHVANGCLTAREARANQTLQEVFAAAGHGDTALGVRGIAVPLVGQDGEHYIAHALPLTSGARRRAGVIFHAEVALFVRKAALTISSRAEVIAQAFKLTPTELRVLLAIVEVGGVPDVAAALGVADTTVRTHVGRLFEKTGAKRQADLIKLVAGYVTPLAV